MCVIAVIKPENKVISEESFKNCWDSNKDGFGMMWYDGVLKIFKTLKYDEALNKYNEVLKSTTRTGDIVLHFRIGTQGGNNLDNCHPFPTANNDGSAFCHNGIITQFSNASYRKSHEGMSDTRIFNEVILKGLPPQFYYCDTTVALIEKFVTTDKLVFMDKDGVSTILNASNGVTDTTTGVWYSNSSYLPKKLVTNSYTKYESKCEICKKVIQTETEIFVRYGKTFGYACCAEHATKYLNDIISKQTLTLKRGDWLKSKTSNVFVSHVGKRDVALIGISNGKTVKSVCKIEYVYNLFPFNSGRNVGDFMDDLKTDTDDAIAAMEAFPEFVELTPWQERAFPLWGEK